MPKPLEEEPLRTAEQQLTIEVVPQAKPCLSTQRPLLRKIRVLHILSDFDIGGAQQVVFDIVRNLDRERFEPYVCLLRRGGALIARLEEQRIPHHLVYFSSRLSLMGLLRLRALLRDLAVDIVHTHLRRANLSGRLAAVWAGTPAIIAHAHDTLHHTRWFHHVLNNWLNRRTRRFLCISEAVAAAQVAEAQLPRTYFTTLHNFIDPADYRSTLSPQLAKAELGVPVGTPCIGMVGRLHPVKRHDLFLEAALLVNQTHPEVHFIIAGEGPLRTALRDRARTLGMSHKVTFTGFSHRPADIYQALDCLVCCSDSEGFGRVLIEAQASGVPVVARNVGGVAEALSGGGGLLVDEGTAQALASAMGAALNTDTADLLRKQMPDNLARFDAGRQITRLEDIYEEILTEASPPQTRIEHDAHSI